MDVNTMINNALFVSAQPLLNKTVELLNTNATLNPHYKNLRQLLSEFQNTAKKSNYNDAMIDDALFFLCSFLDDLTQWPQSFHSLFFAHIDPTHDDFYYRLEQREKDPQYNIDLLELAYMCLSLGYQGQVTDTQDRSIIIDILYRRVQEVRNDPGFPLSKPIKETGEKLWPCPPIWLTILIAIFIGIFIFVPYQKKLNEFIKPALITIQQIKVTSGKTT